MPGRTEGLGPGPGQMGRRLRGGEGAGGEAEPPGTQARRGCGRRARGSLGAESLRTTGPQGHFRRVQDLHPVLCRQENRGRTVFTTSGRGDTHRR